LWTFLLLLFCGLVVLDADGAAAVLTDFVMQFVLGYAA
jgi:hypothetical protein